ncbi:MAG: hypothetical protein CMA72_09255 [Euryarchaeota archaeon]|nr:hypothetical protein [Euryarchaeota archaeon]|tara:strand:+ start:795 stop:1226 length:432 start_codon:yes stop_codon:yes gene_type:complete
MKKLIGAVISAILLLSCGTSWEYNNDRSASLVVRYNGVEEYRRDSRYIGDAELRALLNRGKEVIVVFGADWCGGCDVVRSAIDQAKFNITVHWINMDEQWAQEVAAIMNIKTVPLMLHVGADNKNKAVRIGAGPIVSYLALRY